MQTIIPWNFHEEEHGIVDFQTEERDLAGFIKQAQDHGLLVLLRVGPYVCGEVSILGYACCFSPFMLDREA